MQYLDFFTLASADAEDGYVLSYPSKLEMTCYSDNPYPFKIFPQKGLHRLKFGQVTMLYGGNGSGKSTLLNIIAQKLGLLRSAPFNCTPFFEDYLRHCSASLTYGKNVPPGSRIITSDDVFDFMLDLRAINAGISQRREAVFAEYNEYNDPTAPRFRLRSLDDYDELKRRNEARSKSKSVYTGRRIPADVTGKSNGESAFAYFTHEIRENALYLLDEPENSLSAKLQFELARFIEDSVRFYGCQFIISTHSPFLLAMKDIRIYDLDAVPVSEKHWTELENVRVYHDFFEDHRDEF